MCILLRISGIYSGTSHLQIPSIQSRKSNIICRSSSCSPLGSHIKYADDISDCWKSFQNFTRNFMDKFFPLKIRAVAREPCPWITSNVRKLIKLSNCYLSSRKWSRMLIHYKNNLFQCEKRFNTLFLRPKQFVFKRYPPIPESSGPLLIIFLVKSVL